MIIPLLILAGIIAFILLVTWSILRKKRPKFPQIVKIVVSSLTFLTGIFYLIFPIVNLLVKYNLLNPSYNMSVSEEEVLGTAVIVGLIFFFVALDELVKGMKKK